VRTDGAGGQSRTLSSLKPVNDALVIVNAVAGLPAALLYLVIVLWLIAESMAVPIPCEAILLFAGFLVGIGHLNLAVALAAAVLGTLGGATLAYTVARRLGPAGVRRFGRYVLLTPGRLAAAEGFFRRRGAATIFIARLTPVVRAVISYPAGLAAMRYRPFAVATVLGCAIYSLLVLLVGRAAGEHWTDLFQRFHTLLLVVGLGVLVVGVGYLGLEHTLKRLASNAGQV
jgi:membrane protein DedA with SNARE-associated domain